MWRTKHCAVPTPLTSLSRNSDSVVPQREKLSIPPDKRKAPWSGTTWIMHSLRRGTHAPLSRAISLCYRHESRSTAATGANGVSCVVASHAALDAGLRPGAPETRVSGFGCDPELIALTDQEVVSGSCGARRRSIPRTTTPPIMLLRVGSRIQLQSWLDCASLGHARS